MSETPVLLTASMALEIYQCEPRPDNGQPSPLDDALLAIANNTVVCIEAERLAELEALEVAIAMRLKCLNARGLAAREALAAQEVGNG